MSLQVSEMLNNFQCARTEQNDKLIKYLFKQKSSKEKFTRRHRQTDKGAPCFKSSIYDHDHPMAELFHNS